MAFWSAIISGSRGDANRPGGNNVALPSAASRFHRLTPWQLRYRWCSPDLKAPLYSRARNLHRAARLIMSECGGRIPADPVALRRLPGVGPYIAAAIASIAFGSDEPALDANVRRVLARAFHVELDVRSRLGEMRLGLHCSIFRKGRAGEFNQALMDMGAAICLPRRPRCDECPVRGLCGAYRRGTQSELPIRARRPPIPLRVLGAAVVLRLNRVLVERRDSKGLLGGLWEFPKVTLSHSPGTAPGPGGSFHTRIAATYGLNVRDPKPLIIVRHSYSHFRVTVHAFQCRTRQGSGPRGLQWIRIDRLERYPMGRVDRQIAEKVARSRA
jgi:A/G-specific adenine glycosylase